MRTVFRGLKVSSPAALCAIGLAGISQGQCEEQFLLPSTGGFADGAGHAVAVDGSVLIVGSQLDDVAGVSNDGSATAWERTGNGTWTETRLFLNPAPKQSDGFGSAVSVSGDFIVIGAWRDDNFASNGGGAYVYERLGPGNWMRIASLEPKPPNIADSSMGVSVDIDGDSLVVGAEGDKLAGTSSGSVYFYERSGSTWVGAPSSERLNGSNTVAGDRFGHSVAIDGDTAVVGAYHADLGGFGQAGTAYVFERNPTTGA